MFNEAMSAVRASVEWLLTLTRKTRINNFHMQWVGYPKRFDVLIIFFFFSAT